MFIDWLIDWLGSCWRHRRLSLLPWPCSKCFISNSKYRSCRDTASQNSSHRSWIQTSLSSKLDMVMSCMSLRHFEPGRTPNCVAKLPSRAACTPRPGGSDNRHSQGHSRHLCRHSLCHHNLCHQSLCHQSLCHHSLSHLVQLVLLVNGQMTTRHILLCCDASTVCDARSWCHLRSRKLHLGGKNTTTRTSFPRLSELSQHCQSLPISDNLCQVTLMGPGKPKVSPLTWRHKLVNF